MALKATFRSKFRRNGELRFVFSVSGNPVELDQYRTAQGAFLKEVQPGEPDAGTPLFFLTEYDADGMKRLIKPQYKLLITYGNRIAIDDTQDMMTHMAAVQAQSVNEEAKLRAQASVFRQARVAAPVAPTAAPKAPVADPNQILDDVLNETPSLENAHVGAGDDNLGS